MLQIAVCDDDYQFTEELARLVEQESQAMSLRVNISVFYDGKTLIESIQAGNDYSLIFLDIEMERLDGISAARYIRESDRSTLIIYVSGYDKYFKELFEVEPFRFLSKPVNHEKFRTYFRDACRRIDENKAYFQFIYNKDIQRVPLSDVVYFESRSRVIYIYMADGSCRFYYGKMDDIEKEISDGKMIFLRIHQSYLVNYMYVKDLNYLTLTVNFAQKDIALKISRNRKTIIRHKICELAGGKADIE